MNEEEEKDKDNGDDVTCNTFHLIPLFSLSIIFAQLFRMAYCYTFRWNFYYCRGLFLIIAFQRVSFVVNFCPIITINPIIYHFFMFTDLNTNWSKSLIFYRFCFVNYSMILMYFIEHSLRYFRVICPTTIWLQVNRLEHQEMDFNY